ncbi:MAG: amino acid permease [Acidimicrobiales bacterium]
MKSDVEKLHEMGYAQELNRSMSRFSNFAISFTIISILSGCLTLYGYGLTHGGPPVMIWGWVIVGGLVMFAGLSMAEICSAFPTAGGLYYWAAKLAPGKSGPIWSWFTGWFNLLGQVAVTAGITFGCGYSVGAFIGLVTGGGNWTANNHVVVITGILLLIQGMINTFGVNIVSLINRVSVWWHLLGVAIIVILLYVAPHSHSHQSGGFLFGATGFDAFKGLSGFSAPFYVFLLGLLVAQYTFTGYDASAHVTEETNNAQISGPKGIVSSIWVSWIAGFILLVGVSEAIPKFTHGLSVTIAGVHYTSYAAFSGGVPWANVFEYSTGRVMGELLVLVVIGAQFFCGIASITANSRMIYAFSRDGAVPFSEYWHHVSKRSHVPVHSAWFGAVGAFILTSPALIPGSAGYTAYAAVTSIAVIGLYVAYLIPVFLRRINPTAFTPGPWKLGKWGPFMGWVAIVWVVIICVLFCLPTLTPINRDTFNYTPVAVVVVIGFAGIWYAVSARKWFKGPKVQGSPEELAAIERELSV